MASAEQLALIENLCATERNKRAETEKHELMLDHYYRLADSNPDSAARYEHKVLASAASLLRLEIFCEENSLAAPLSVLKVWPVCDPTTEETKISRAARNRVICAHRDPERLNMLRGKLRRM